MKKVLVETTGDFMLVVPETREHVEANRPSVVAKSGFVAARAGMGDISILAELQDTATDEEFLKYWEESQGDAQLAVESYVSSFGDESVKVTKKASKGNKDD